MAVPTESGTSNWTTDKRRSDLLGRGLRALRASWEFPLLRRRAGAGGLILAVVLLCGLRAFVGMIGSRDFSHDAFMLFDGAWRMVCGQIPHRDFYTHVGFLTYLPTVVGLWISRGTAWSLGYGQALAGLVLGIWVLLLGRKRLESVPAALMCLSVVLIAVAPFAIGFSPMKPSPAMIYNRQGYGLLALLLVEAFETARDNSAAKEFRGGFSSGAVLGIALFLKITYFVIGGFLLFALLLCRPQRRERWAGIAAGFLAVTIACCAYFRFQMWPMLRDLLTVGGGKHIRFGWYIIDGVLGGALLVAAFGAAAALLLLSRKQQMSGRDSLVIGLAAAVAGTLLILGNYEQNGFPLTVFVAILLLNRITTRVPAERGQETDFFEAAILLIGSALILSSLLSGTIGITFAVAQRAMQRSEAPFRMPRLSGFNTGPDDDWYAALVNDGIPLVERYRRPGDSLMSLDFTNPYSYGLGMRPAYGGTTVFQYGTTFNDKSKPSPDFLFGAADLVAVPIKASDPTLDFNVPRLYGQYLQSRFHLLGESRGWRLYRRNGE